MEAPPPAQLWSLCSSVQFRHDAVETALRCLSVPQRWHLADPVWSRQNLFDIGTQAEHRRQPITTRVDGNRPLGIRPQSETGSAEKCRFLLQSARVGQNETRLF